jgi:hypothetical protein
MGGSIASQPQAAEFLQPHVEALGVTPRFKILSQQVVST